MRFAPWIALVLAGCGAGTVTTGEETALDGLALTGVMPRSVVPGTRVILSGAAFVDSDFGESRLHLQGTIEGRPVDVRLPVLWEGYDRLVALWSADTMGPGRFVGDAVVETESLVDGATYRSAPLPISLRVASALEPRLDVLGTGVIFVNEPVVVEGDGLLLGDSEGTTVAIVQGTFDPDDGPVIAVDPVAVPVVPDGVDRTRGTFAFEPAIAGIEPGRFDGTVRLENRHGQAASDAVLGSAPTSAVYDLVPPRVFEVAPATVSLGQYVQIKGGGFVGARPGQNSNGMGSTGLPSTVLELSGVYTPAGTTSGVPVTLTLVPEFVSGPLVRYVVNEEDQLGMATSIRQANGTFIGQLVPVTSYAGDTVRGDSASVTLGLRPVVQVVWINFLPSYIESLRAFGLRAVDHLIRARVLEVAHRDFEGLAVDFRTESPDDFALFSRVDLAGPDPNGLGLLGYDNTPGKDVNNVRLGDLIGGVNATTQTEGFPGFGGVFVESFFGFSMHPGRLAMGLPGADPLFDAIFDPFRPDTGGAPVRLAEITGGKLPAVTSGTACPATSRPQQIACAIWVLGSMTGNTMTHEIGHSLGLARPFASGFHNSGDAPNRLMDAGGARPFVERAEIQGFGPARFCESAYDYLRGILPSSEPAPAITRPACD